MCQWKNKAGRLGMSLVYPTLSVQTCNGHTGQGASPYRLVSIASVVQGQSIAYQSMMMAICISNIIHRKSKTLVSKAMNLYWRARVKRMCRGNELVEWVSGSWLGVFDIQLMGSIRSPWWH